ncbi:hypothetical protein N9M41_02220 [Rhodopirellula sp.]|jgi:hypothetical protein|nr:hypothetical protein [Rhodopirellula sp.]MDA9778544.1 hypothetical protein [Rubripirellula sp.]
MASLSKYRFLKSFLTLCTICELLAVGAVCGSEPDVWKIEEDWELETYQSDPVIISPQITFFTVPDNRDSSTYFQLQMNYAADDSFSAGGFHVAAIRNDDSIDEERSEQQIALSFNSDLLKWTNVMAVVNNEVLFAVKDGIGQEWGDFGGPEYLVRIGQTSITDLRFYDHQLSVESVDVGFGKNRVSSIKLKRVRLFRIDGTTTTIELKQ